MLGEERCEPARDPVRWTKSKRKGVEMRQRRIRAALAVALVAGIATARGDDVRDLSEALVAADRVWLAEGPETAIPKYRSILDAISTNAAFARPTLLMRVARAEAARGNTSGALRALDRLSELRYVPEHVALAANETRAVLNGRPNPGLQKTPVPPIEAPVRTLCVATNGTPDGNGSAQRPFASLAEAVAALTAAPPTRGRKTILLAPGRYEIDTPVSLRGLSDLTIRSADPERPAILSGGIALGHWKPVVDADLLARIPAAAKSRALRCDLSEEGVPEIGPLVFGGFSSRRAGQSTHRFRTMPLPELFLGNRALPMATWPDEGFVRLPIREAPKEDLDRYLRWRNEPDLWLHGYWANGWADAYEKVASIDAAGVMLPEEPCNRYGLSVNKGRAVNALCEMDRPGEWYYDARRRLVVLYPPADFERRPCVLSAFETPIRAENCNGLRFRNLRLEFVRGDALIVSNCSDTLFYDLSIAGCSGLGIRAIGGTNHLFHSCSVSNMGRGGLDVRAGDWTRLRPGHVVVENCRISNLSRIDRTYTPALLIEGMGATVQYCEFRDLPSSAIRIEACDVLVRLNRFVRCVYESDDQGAIDTWGNPLYRGNVVRWNRFESIRNPKARYGAAAVRCDDLVCGFAIAENLMLYGTDHGFGAAGFNKGTDNYVEGNVIVDWGKAYSGCSVRGEEWKERLLSHKNAKRVLSEVDWRNPAWSEKYPMVERLFEASDNRNYFIGNVLVDVKETRAVRYGAFVANRRVEASGPVESEEDVRKLVPPWYVVPSDRIGPY